MSIESEDYRQLGYKLSTPPKRSFVSAMADTGCQSCLAGFQVVKKLGISTKDLIPVHLNMHAADNHNIRILGAILLLFSGKNSKGEEKSEKSTRQMVYVTDRTDKLFLSREGCADLGIIPHTFPTMDRGDHVSAATTTNTSHQEKCETQEPDPISAATTSRQEKFQCPRRTKPPPHPTSVPFSATEANRESLQQYLLNYYGSSTFNVCEHQTLPMMDGPPMRLLIDTQAIPTAHHSPIPVPLHWQDEVKADLDRDLRLGVPEPVPIGEPVTWCHRMVICAKKNGKPRRTIDFQPLNVHATMTPSCGLTHLEGNARMRASTT